MAIVRSTASDSTYHSRHSRRTLGRAKRIADQIDSPGALLDVGCNNGITSAYLLDVGKASRITGIELLAETVEEAHKRHPDFTLLEGNVVELELPETYDYIVYGAVHHHILNLFGLSSAVRTFQKLVNHCTKHIFFETGQIGEGGRWAWQAAMRRHFRTDEEHFFYMLRSIEHRIRGFEVIGSFWIHGIRRHYLRIDVRPHEAGQQHDWQAWPAEIEGPYVRSRGSRNQVLQLSNNAAASDSPTHFWIAGNQGQRLFVKKHVHLPIAGDDEWAIGSQLEKQWAVKPVARLQPDGALAYPYLADAKPLDKLGSASVAERRQLAAAVEQIFKDACETRVYVPDGVLLSPGKVVRLVDAIDLNANNFLEFRAGNANVVRVVDFELQSMRYAPRNRIHVARILLLLRQRKVRALGMLLRGLGGIGVNLVRYQFIAFSQRVIDRQPSLASLLVADLRTLTGKLAGKLLRVVGLE